MKQYASMRTIASELMSTGHQVEFYVRKDGGILITKIDGQRFSGAKGNARARAMTGQNISEARFAQLKYATASKKLLNTPRFKKIKVPDAVQKEYDRVHKKWTKAFKAKGNKPHPAGYYGKVRLLKSVESKGEEGAKESISEAERYASGIAYSENIKHLATQVELSGAQYESEELMKLAQEIRDNASTIRDEWVYPAYQELYKLNKGYDPKEVVNNVKKILRLPL